MSIKTKFIAFFIIMFAIIRLIYYSPAIRLTINPHDINYLPDGTYSFYVLMNNGKKEYTLPAEITIISDTYSESTNQERERLTSHADIYLSKVFFKNGGYLYFDDRIIELNEKTLVMDQNGIDWDCTLLNKHANNNKVKETVPNLNKSFFRLIIRCLALMFCLIIIVKPNKKDV